MAGPGSLPSKEAVAAFCWNEPKSQQTGPPIILVTVLMLPQFVAAEEPDAPPRSVALAATDVGNDGAAIENCLKIVRRCQMVDGMIRFKGVGDPVWMVSYVSTFAAMALLAANDLRPNQEDVRRVEHWLSEYADHLVSSILKQGPQGRSPDRITFLGRMTEVTHQLARQFAVG